MKFYLSRSLVVLLVCSVAFPWVPPLARGQNDCGTVQDASYQLSQDYCGNTEWYLQVAWDGGVIDQYGQAQAFGHCTSSYYNCSNVYVPQGHIDGEHQFYDDGPTSAGENVHWTLDDWTVTYSSCNNGNSSDEIQNAQNSPYPTPEFEVVCA